MKNQCIDCGKDCSGQRCKSCFINKVGKKFEFEKWNFNTQKALDKAIKLNLQFLPYNKEIEDEFLLAVINNLHESVKKRNLKCTKIKIIDYNNQVGEWEFCRKRFRGGIFVTGFFEPINKWHGVTLYPHKRNKGKIKPKLIACLRQKWSEQAEQREPNAKCEICGNPHPQLHHENITFKEIAEQCLPYFSSTELTEGLGEDWWWHESEADAIPNSHPSVKKMIELHEKVVYKWVCRGCHIETF